MTRYYFQDIEAQDFYENIDEYILKSKKFDTHTVMLCINNNDICIVVKNNDDLTYIINSHPRTDDNYNDYDYDSHDYLRSWMEQSNEMFKFICSIGWTIEHAYDDINEYTKYKHVGYLGEMKIDDTIEIGNVKIEKISYTERTGYDGRCVINSQAVKVSIGDIYAFSMRSIDRSQANNIFNVSKNMISHIKSLKERESIDI